MSEHETEGAYDSIYVISSLPPGDLRTGENLAFDRLKTRLEPQQLVVYREVASASEFFAVLQEVREQARTGRQPIVHIDMHGADDGTGLVISPTNEIVTWSDFVDACRAINQLTGNNLIVVMAVCFGLNAITKADITKLTPFLALVGPQSEVDADLVARGFSAFYDELINSGDLNASIEKLGPKFKLHIAEQGFLLAFAHYYEKHCLGKAKAHRVERLLSEYRRRVPQSIMPLNFARGAIKQALREGEADFNRFRKTFLLGSRPSRPERFTATFADAVRLAESIRRANAKR